MLEEISAHVYKHAKIMAKRPGELAWVLVYPFISVLSIGILVSFMISNGAPIESMMFVFVGVVVWNVYSLSQRGITYGVTFDIWSMSLKHAFIAKSSIASFIIGNSLFGLLSSLATVILVGLVGWIFFGFNLFLAGFFLVNLFFVFVFATAIGLIINGLMLSKGDKFMSLIWMGTGIIMIFSGIYYPITILPGPLQYIAQGIPVSHSLMSLRASLGFNPEAAVGELLIGAGLSIVYLAIGTFLFKLGLKRGRTSGMITKL